MNEKNRRKRRQQRRKQMRNQRRVMVVLFLMVLVVGFGVAFGSYKLCVKANAYAAQKAELEQEIAEENARSKEIDSLEKRVGTDEYIEEIAREKLGLVFEGETIFKSE